MLPYNRICRCVKVKESHTRLTSNGLGADLSLILLHFFVCVVGSSRYFHWKLQLYIMLFTEIVVLPFYIAYFLVINIRFCKYHDVCTCCSHRQYRSVSRSDKSGIRASLMLVHQQGDQWRYKRL